MELKYDDENCINIAENIGKMKMVQYGTTLKNISDIYNFLRSIGEMKCECMIAFKTLWEENSWLVYGHNGINEKYISLTPECHGKTVLVLDKYSERKIIAPIEDIHLLTIKSGCRIFIE